LECVAEDRHDVPAALLIDRTGELLDDAVVPHEPTRIDRRGAEGIAEDIADECGLSKKLRIACTGDRFTIIKTNGQPWCLSRRSRGPCNRSIRCPGGRSSRMFARHSCRRRDWENVAVNVKVIVSRCDHISHCVPRSKTVREQLPSLYRLTR